MPAPKSRAELGLPATGTLYLFPHSPFKIHPDNDALVARVLAADPGGVLVTFAGQTAEATRAIGERLRATAGIDAARMVVLPAMGHHDYLRVNCACDALLDTLHWSGGNTSLDALACGLPMVTLPGALMRGRQTAAMLQMAGVPEQVARDADDYVRIAVRLGTDPVWRSGSSVRLVAGAAAVFDRREPIEALARFLATGTT